MNKHLLCFLFLFNLFSFENSFIVHQLVDFIEKRINSIVSLRVVDQTIIQIHQRWQMSYGVSMIVFLLAKWVAVEIQRVQFFKPSKVYQLDIRKKNTLKNMAILCRQPAKVYSIIWMTFFSNQCLQNTLVFLYKSLKFKVILWKISTKKIGK